MNNWKREDDSALNALNRQVMYLHDEKFLCFSGAMNKQRRSQEDETSENEISDGDESKKGIRYDHFFISIFSTKSFKQIRI